jgi:hypothetical protein
LLSLSPPTLHTPPPSAEAWLPEIVHDANWAGELFRTLAGGRKVVLMNVVSITGALWRQSNPPPCCGRVPVIWQSWMWRVPADENTPAALPAVFSVIWQCCTALLPFSARPPPLLVAVLFVMRQLARIVEAACVEIPPPV